MWFLGLFTICTGLFRHCVVKTFWHGESLTPHGEITHLFLRPSYHTHVTRLISLSYLYHTSDFQPSIYHTSGFFAICVSHTWFLCHMYITHLISSHLYIIHPISLPYVYHTTGFLPIYVSLMWFLARCISHIWFPCHRSPRIYFHHAVVRSSHYCVYI